MKKRIDEALALAVQAIALATVLLAAIHITDARAGKMMDEFLKLPPAGQCQQMAQVYREGIVGRNEGFGREIANLDKSLLPQYQAGEFKPEHDKMYVFGWDDLDEDVQALFTILVQAGWDDADKVLTEEYERLKNRSENREYIGRLNVYLDPGKVFHMTGEFLRSCMDNVGTKI
jgi:hypothetical protein